MVVKSSRFPGEKSEVKNLVLLSFKANFLIPEKQRILKIFFVDFLTHPELRKRDKKVADSQETAESCGIAEVKF